MRRLALALVTALGASTASAEEPAPAWVDQARAGAGALGSQLQQALKSAIAEGGPVAGIEVCRIRAPEIASDVSGSRIDVGRTSLKVRNPDNAPDALETRILEDFERRLAGGENPGDIEAFVIRNDGERRYGHWMKAIPTQGLCTVCHGTDIPPEVAEAIDAAYPRDQARGFSVGELRGAFSVEVDLQAD
ncbi:Tll0287-like domain-containing protein [Wenzhouxiangella sediminis]|uniref:DUF3365 domain-containing protein n=1 Tax=Wenzhouxiangella sediminis TaxID=1792836 RepID=A0A3E1K9G6_9GAMM|nr:DUF3365 domain-containing protein [Wenzhouxiangella sediminis]RFF30823.1 DUF3365 domain-containing protein [Wenzhouxiangella sediminis]